mmetsp:Transcript_22557/g.21783  ORF Transcript_22557/g.21783 Transcript_22557/m.21783 type:complete len:454 (+) Transcript_22557:752-2113(+)
MFAVVGSILSMVMGYKDNDFPSLPTETILGRLKDCRTPNDKRLISEYLEMIEIKLEVYPEVTARELAGSDGVRIVFKISKGMKNDVDVQCIICALLELLKINPEVITHFVQLGIVDHLEEVKTIHPRKDFFKAVIPPLIRTIFEVGTRQAVIEIDHEKANLQFCKHCIEVAYRNKNKAYKNSNNVSRKKNHFKSSDIPKDNERVNKVTYYMLSYPKAEVVQVAGLDAIIVFARSGDAKSTILETSAIVQTEYALSVFPEVDGIVWRVCIAFTCMSTLRQECAVQIMSLNVHNHLVHTYREYDDNNRIKQQILWVLNSFLLWPRSRLLFQQSADCMGLLKALDYRNRLNDESEVSVSQKAQNPGIYSTLVIPLEIRIFIRETKGLVSVVPKKNNPEDEYAMLKKSNYTRMKLDQSLNKTKYGTLETTLYAPGDKGLHEDDPVDDVYLLEAKEMT